MEEGRAEGRAVSIKIMQSSPITLKCATVKAILFVRSLFMSWHATATISKKISELYITKILTKISYLNT